MKADNEPAISLPVYYKSIKKRKYVYKKQKNATKKREKSLLPQESKPGPPTCEVNVLSIAPQQLMLNKAAKLIIFKIFAHKILPEDTV